MSKSLLFAALAVISASFCFGQVPQTLSYQGLLTDNNGAALQDQTYTVTFRFYNVESGGTPLLGEFRQLDVLTFKGLFSVTLGNSLPNATVNGPLSFSLADQTNLYVGITVSPSSAELTRVKITAVPYAFVANSVKNVDATIINAGILPIARIADNSITNAKLLTGIDGSKIGTGINAANITSGNLTLTGSDAAKLPVGTTAQRPFSTDPGQIRYNSTEKVMEYYNGTNWYFMVPKVAFIKEAEAQGNGAGVATAGAWTARDLNVIYGDDNNTFVVLTSATDFTLTAGEYIIEASAPFLYANFARIRLYNSTGNTDVIGSPKNGLQSNNYGTNGFTAAGTTVSTTSELAAIVSISSPTAFKIQYLIQLTGGTSTLGATSNIAGAPEIYTQIKITKLR